MFSVNNPDHESLQRFVENLHLTYTTGSETQSPLALMKACSCYKSMSVHVGGEPLADILLRSGATVVLKGWTRLFQTV